MKNSQKINSVVEYLNNILELKNFPCDISNNGLQVEANEYVSKIALAVDASMATFEAAKQANCDMIIVHHGISWGSEPRRFSGDVGKRLQFLFCNQINLYASHLPLDANREFGHNEYLANICKLQSREMFFSYNNVDIGVIGELPQTLSSDEIAALYQSVNPRLKTYGVNKSNCHRVGCISGGSGLSGLLDAVKCGADCLITGEFDHTMYHTALENNITVISLGHYASECSGVKALGDLISHKFGIQSEFIDIPTNL